MLKGVIFLLKSKRFIIILGVILTTIFISTSILAAGFNQEDLLEPVDKTLKFVFIPKVVHPWYDVVRAGAEKAIEEFADQGIKIDLKWDAPPTAEITAHMKKIEANISARPDGMAIAVLDPATNTQVINDAVNAGLNVVTFDTDAPDSLRACYIGHDKNFEDGYVLGEFLAKKINYKGEVAILSGTLSAPNHVGRVNGFKAAIEQYPYIKIVTERPDNDSLQKAMELTENIIQAFPNIDGFFGCNATNPIGAARAVENAGLVGKVHIVGMDDLDETIQYVQKGVIDAVKIQRQWEIGYWTVKYLVAMNQNHTIPEEHPTGSKVITGSDLN
ncbi:substrate-binding domain-containing protein [Iocasia frigidifontis]|uniref:Substrate-binding domain-containing protein n=1 Tax=Iocasia fonsfrigidae TaxID=2682810 RepID=A0A8A7KDF6_9FIRM|nr:substrate-binding domain-containing protein [Iocasia fonsfrigidae]